MKTKKLLAVIVNYGETQLKYLDKVLAEFESFKDFEVDIIIHSNIELQIFEQQYNNITVKIEELDDYEELPFTTRMSIYENKDKYDFFIYNENDHLFKESHIKSFIEAQKVLPKSYVAGHIQYEEYDEGYFYPAYHWHYHWRPNTVERYGDYIVAEFSNKHQASFLLSKEQLNTVIENQGIDNFISDNLRDGYNQKPRAGTTVYTMGGFKKVIPISHFKDFMLHHLPNKYKDHIGKYDKQMGSFDDTMQNDLKLMTEKLEIKERLTVISDELTKPLIVELDWQQPQIEVFVRHCNCSENSVGKTRLPSFSRELCYHNLKRTVRNARQDGIRANITFMMDGDVDNHFLKDEKEYKVVSKQGGTDAHSFLNLLNYVRGQSFDDDTIIYLLEDDFFHIDGWCEALIEGFYTSAPYVSLYDHNDKYNVDMYRGLKAQILPTRTKHWRTSPSTTNTYAMKFGTFKEDFETHKEFCDLERGFTRDHDKFMRLNQLGKYLVTSIPGYSTHMEVEYQSPTIDWEEKLREEQSILIGEE